MKTIDIYRFRRLLVFPTLINIFSVVEVQNLKKSSHLLEKSMEYTSN